MSEVAPPRVLIAGVGNLLRRDDGFGIVALRATESALAGERRCTFVESGIAGVGLVQHLMDGYDALILLDAVDQGSAPGTVHVLRPDVRHLAADRAERSIDLHQTDPGGVLMMAAGLGILPERVWIVGCQAEDCDELGEGLSDPVRDGVPEAVRRVAEILAGLERGIAGSNRVQVRAARSAAPPGPAGGSVDELSVADEVLQVMYWLRGEHLAADVAAGDLTRWVGLEPDAIAALLARLDAHGLVRQVPARAGEPRFALTAEGVTEGGRRFADEFADMTKPGHGECGDPDCICHETGDPGDCRHHAG